MSPWCLVCADPTIDRTDQYGGGNMSKGNQFSRRDSLKTIAAGGGLVGGNALGAPSAVADEESESDNETKTENGTDTDDEAGSESEANVGPNAIALIPACADVDRAFATFRIDNDNDVAVTLTAEGDPIFGEAGSVAGKDGEEGESTEDGGEPVERINAIVSDLNARLENVENIGTVDEITDGTADELQRQILTQTVAEINAQSQDILGRDIAKAVSTPGEARTEGERIEEEYGVAAKEAVVALNEAADAVETVHTLSETESNHESEDDGGTATDESDPTEDAVTTVNDGAVASVNRNIEELNARLENVESIASLDEVEAGTADEAGRLESEADRLQNDIFTRMVAEINTQSRDIIGEDIADEVSTPDEARAEGENIEEEYGVAAREAVVALNDAADTVEEIRVTLADAADTLRADDDRLTVDANTSVEMRVGLGSDSAATVSLYHEDEEVATETAEAETLPGCDC